MQTVWKGAISFGLLNVPVKMGSATKKESISFRQLHKACNTPINQKRFCSKCNKEVAYEDIVKGFEYEPGKFVLVTNEELESLPIKSAKYMDIVDFIHIEEVDPVYFDKTYYLWPEKGGEKSYLILRDAMRQTGRVAVAKVTMREKEHLCLIRLIGDTISVAMMYFQDEIRDTAELGIEKLAETVTVRPEEMDMAIQLVQNLTSEFKPEKYHDAYREELLKLIRAKVEGKEIVEPEAAETTVGGNVVDLMERLRQSVEATKAKNEQPVTKEKKPRKRKAAGS